MTTRADTTAVTADSTSETVDAGHMGNYWGSTYWSANYWNEEYWGGEPVASGAYWSSTYWANRYWANHYWAGLTYGSGNVIGSINATVSFTAQFLSAQVDIFDIQVRVGPTWLANEYTANVGSIAVTLDDSTSAIAGTFVPSGAFVGTIASTLADYTSAISGTHVAPANRTGTLASTLDGLTGAFTGTQSPLSTGTIDSTLADVTSAFTGLAYVPGVTVASIATLLEDATSNFRGTFSSVAVLDPGPQNPLAVPVVSNYVICDRTGFRIPIGDLRAEWTGAKVRMGSWEARHPQDFVRGRVEKRIPTPRPEQPDRFITTQVNPEDL